MAQISPKWPQITPKMAPTRLLKRTVHLWTVPLFTIWVNSGHFRPEKGGETAKENWTGGKFNLVMFLDMGLLFLNSIFSAQCS